MTLVVLATCSAVAVRPARAETCVDPLLDPPSVGLRDTGFDASRAACARSDIQTRTRALALIDTENFYGTLSGSSEVGLRMRAFGFDLGVGARLLDFRFAQNAVITASELSTGPLYVSAMRPVLLEAGTRKLTLSPGLRIAVPASDLSYDQPTTTIAASLFASLPYSRRVAVHGRIAGLGWAVAPVDNPSIRAAFILSADAVAMATTWLYVGAGLESQAGWYSSGLDHLLFRLLARVPLGCRYALDVAAALPAAGDERIDVVMQIALTRQL